MPATNPKAAALERLLSTDAGYTYGNVLPLAKNNQTGALSPAMPGVVRSGLQGLADLVNMRTAPSAQPGVNTLTPDSLGALMGMPAGGVAPAGAVATGAARRAALPMDEASRMARAKEMGANLDEVWHHGTPVDLYKTKEGGFRGGDDRVTFGSSSPFVAEGYTRGEISLSADATGKYPLAKSDYPDMKDGGVYSLRSLAKNVREIDAHGEPWFNLKMDQDLAAARSAGHEAVIYRNIDDNMYTKGMKSDVIVWLDPTKIRATGAAFDPAKKDSTDLLASRSPGYPLAWQQQDVPDRKKLARALSKVQK